MTMASSSVSFSTPSDSNCDESGIVVRDMGRNVFAVNLGFLKHNHIYQISFFVADAFADRQMTFDPLQSLHFRVENVEASRDPAGHRIEATLTAAKEKLMREKVTLVAVGKSDAGDAGDAEIKLEINARVLGKDKGTPALKAGVHNVGVDRDLDEDSEQSDWQGFS